MANSAAFILSFHTFTLSSGKIDSRKKMQCMAVGVLHDRMAGTNGSQQLGIVGYEIGGINFVCHHVSSLF